MHFSHHKSLLFISVLFTAVYAAPAPGWAMLRNALMPALDLLSMFKLSLLAVRGLTPAELDARQASNITTGSNSTSDSNSTTPAGSIPTAGLDCIAAEPGDTCDVIASQLDISLTDFLAANPSVDAACDNLLAGTVYCA